MNERFNIMFWVGVAFLLAAAAASIVLFLVNVNLAMVGCSVVLVCIACGAFYASANDYQEKRSLVASLENLKGNKWRFESTGVNEGETIFVLKCMTEGWFFGQLSLVRVPEIGNQQIDAFFQKHGFRLLTENSGSYLSRDVH